MATSEQLDQLVKTLVDAGREDTPELRAELSAMLQPISSTHDQETDPGGELITALTKTDLESRARLAAAWGVPDARKLIADVAAQWATEAVNQWATEAVNSEPKRKK